MKTVYAMRHGEAAKAKNGQDDLLRPLTKAGKKDVRSIARSLKKAEVRIDLILTSSARRARQTADIVAKQIGYDTEKIIAHDRLYQRLSPADHLQVLKEIDAQHNSVLIVGHVPNLNELISAHANRVAVSLPAGGLAQLEFNKASGSALTQRSGKLASIELPLSQVKSKMAKQTRKSLQAELSQSAQNILRRLDPAATIKFAKYVDGSSKKLAARFMSEISTFKLTGDAALQAISRASDKKSAPQQELIPDKQSEPAAQAATSTGTPAQAAKTRNKKPASKRKTPAR